MRKYIHTHKHFLHIYTSPLTYIHTRIHLLPYTHTYLQHTHTHLYIQIKVDRQISRQPRTETYLYLFSTIFSTSSQNIFSTSSIFHARRLTKKQTNKTESEREMMINFSHSIRLNERRSVVLVTTMSLCFVSPSFSCLFLCSYFSLCL